MKAILTGLLLVCSILAIAQTDDFFTIERTIKDHIKNGRWDEVVVTAPDLVIADPTKGNGYYYTAMAFLKLNQPDKASEYLAQAEPLADTELKALISTLKNEINQYRNANQVLELAEKQEKQGSKRAADEWKKLWELDKMKTEFALNAVELYVEQKNYPQALEILKDPALANDPGAQALYKRINNTPEMTKINGYNEALLLGKQNMKNGNFNTAISNFATALRFQPGDAEAGSQKKLAEDELAWQTTRKTNTLESFENYLKGSTIRNHRTEADDIVMRALIRFGNKAAADNNFKDMEYYFGKYMKQYPNGSETAAARQTMCDTYQAAANKEKDKKTAFAQKQSIAYLTKVQTICSSTPALETALKTANKKAIRYGRPNRGFIAYVYDSLAPIGLSFGTINNRKVGMYVTVRANENFFQGNSFYTVNDQGIYDGSVFDDVRPTGETRTSHFDGMLGLTKKIAFPLWLYAGGGINYSQLSILVDEYNDSGRFVESEWIKNTDQQFIKPVVEAGAIIDVGGFQLRGGGKMIDFKDIYYTLGIGFSFRRG